MAMNDFNIGFIAGLDGTKSKAKLNQDIDAIKKSLKELELKAKLDPNQVKALENQLNSLKVNLNNVSIDKASLDNLVSQINNSLSGIKLQIPNLNTGNVGNQAQQVGQQIGQQIQNGINSVIQKGSFEKIFRASGNGINNVSKDAEKYFKTLSNTVSVQERLGTNNNLTSFTVSLKNAEGVAEQLNYQLRKITDDKGNIIDRYFEYSGGSINDNGVIKQLNTISAKADSLQTKLEKLKSSYSDMNASRPIKDSNNISALSQQYDKVAKSIENVRNADSASFSSMVSNAQREITVLENMVSQFRNAENVATQMKSVDISSGIAQAQERLGKLKANASSFDQMKQTIVDLDTAIANVGDKSSLDAFINKLKVAESQLGRVKAETKQLQDVNKIQLSYANGDYEAKVQSTIAKTQQWVNANGEARISTTSLSTALSNLDKAYLAITADGGNTVANQKALKQAESELGVEIKKVTNDVTKMNATMAKSSAVDALRQKYQMFYDTNTAAHRKWGKSLLSAISELAPGAEVSKQRIKELEQGLINTSNAARQAGKLGLSFFDTIKQGMSKFSYWTSSTFIIMKTVQEVKQMISNVEELDDALTNISYTMDVSDKQLEKIGNSSLEMAKDLHTSASNVLDAVKTYANANETAESILNKARATIMMSNVSGMGTDQTVDIIQGTVEQFDLSDTEEQLMHISDVLQTVSANMPMDFSKGLNELSEGIQTSGQTAKTAGYDLESYTALLGTLISKTRQSGSELGRSLRTMMLRTTKASTTALASGEVTEDDLSNAEKSLRRVGIEVRSDMDTFKDFDQIIAELYGKLDTLSDVDMSNLAYELAGIRQSNVFKMMIASYGEYLDMAEKANNADGMTLTNQEKYAESLKGKITELSAIWENIGDDTVSSSWLKGLTDVGIGVSSLVEKFGLLKTAIVGIGAYAGIKNVGVAQLY